MAEIFCEVCNAEVPQGALACPVCGTPVSKPVREETDGAPVNTPAAPPEFIDLAEVTIPSEQMPQEPETPPEESQFTEDIPADIGLVADESVAPGVVIHRRTSSLPIPIPAVTRKQWPVRA